MGKRIATQCSEAVVESKRERNREGRRKREGRGERERETETERERERGATINHNQTINVITWF